MCENYNSQFHRHFPFWLSDQILSADNSQAILSQPSPTLALPRKLMLSVSSTFASVQPPAYSKVYLEKLISLSFLILGNVKATLYPKTNLMLIKQKPLLKWGWPCRRNAYKESGSPMITFSHAEFLSAAALQPLCFSSHTFANTSKKFICNAVTCNQSNYLCSFNNEKLSLL